MLLIWSRAKVFSHLNGLPLVTSSWWGIRPGAWLRNEKQKRLYWGYFKESPVWQRLYMQMITRFLPVFSEPEIVQTKLYERPAVYRFSNPISRNELFGSIKQHRDWIKKELYMLLQPKLAQKIDSLETPDIAVHIRRGDFKQGSTITPTDFFIRCIRFVRTETGRDMGVTIYTDALPEEIADVLQLENVRLARRKPDILDILEMSRSKVLVLSQTSTFSYWAAFLSDGIVIKPHGDWYGDIRPPEVNASRFEGTVSFDLPGTLAPLKQGLLSFFS